MGNTEKKSKIITCHFDEIALWLRFKLACSLWWDVFVNKALDCTDDDEECEKRE